MYLNILIRYEAKVCCHLKSKGVCEFVAGMGSSTAGSMTNAESATRVKMCAILCFSLPPTRLELVVGTLHQSPWRRKLGAKYSTR